MTSFVPSFFNTLLINVKFHLLFRYSVYQPMAPFVSSFLILRAVSFKYTPLILRAISSRINIVLELPNCEPYNSLVKIGNCIVGWPVFNSHFRFLNTSSDKKWIFILLLFPLLEPRLFIICLEQNCSW